MMQKDFQEPLARAKGLGAAHDGVHHWIYQRVTAIALILLSIWLLYNLSNNVADDFDIVTAWLSDPWHSAGLFLFVTTATYHAMLGVQVIIEDYVHKNLWRYSILLAVKIFAVAIPALSLFFLIKIVVGGSE